MFFETAKRLNTVGLSDQTEINIHLDAFAIHARNLFEFLYPKKPGKTEVAVGDYIEEYGKYRINKTKKRELKTVWSKTSRQVAHLTYRRNRYSGISKAWIYGKVAKDMHETLVAFYEALPSAYKQWPWFLELKNLLGI